MKLYRPEIRDIILYVLFSFAFVGIVYAQVSIDSPQVLGQDIKPQPVSARLEAYMASTSLDLATSARNISASEDTRLIADRLDTIISYLRSWDKRK